jgi:putative hydrolase of the HAD superfamily
MADSDVILFDLGHTLIDFRTSKEALLEVYVEVHSRLSSVLGQEILSAKEMSECLPGKISEIIDASYKSLKAIEELQMSDVVTEAFGCYGLRLPDELVNEMVHFEHRSFSGSMILARGAGDVLSQLKAWGFRIGLVSNATNLAPLLRIDLQRLGILQYFDATVFSSEVGLRKPHPDIYLFALEGIGGRASQAIFVGDRIREDIVGPQSLGMRAVLTHQFRQENPNGVNPEGIVKDVGEVLAVAGRVRVQ